MKKKEKAKERKEGKGKKGGKRERAKEGKDQVILECSMGFQVLSFVP